MSLYVKNNIFHFCILFLLCSCLESGLNTRFNDAAKRQDSLSTRSIALFESDPTLIANDPLINANSSLQRLQRQNLEFSGLLSLTSPLEHEDIKFFQNTSLTAAPTFSRWAGLVAPWDSPDFKALMAYYHTVKAHDYAQRMFEDLTSKQSGIFPIRFVYDELGDPLRSNYASHSDQPNQITFYRDSNQLTFIDSPDAIYHEYSHVLQHVLSPEIFAEATNPHINSLLEGLSDFYAAAVAGQEDILGYLNANFHLLVGNFIMGNGQNRRLKNNLFFPNDYFGSAIIDNRNGQAVGSYHLDGRVVASTLNDIRRYLNGERVDIPNKAMCGNNCELILSESQFENKEESFFEVNLLAYETYESMGNNTSLTLHGFGLALLNQCSSKSWCSSYADEVEEIIKGRGLVSLADTVVIRNKQSLGLSHIDQSNGATRIVYETQAHWIPLSSSRDIISNKDNLLQPCESIIAFPSLRNVSTQNPIDIYGSALLKDLSGVENVRNGNRVFEDVLGNLESRHIQLPYLRAPGTHYGDDESILERGDSVLSLMNNANSYLYSEKFGSFYTRPITIEDNYRSNLGYAMEAPSRIGQSAEFEFDIKLYVYNTEQFAEIQETISHVLPISSASEVEFCGN